MSTDLEKETATAALLEDVQARKRREILAALVRGEQEIAEGTGYDLDEVLAEADQLLARYNL